MKNLYVLTFCLLFCFSLSAQIVINEFSAANSSDTQDNFNEYEDWVELYNTSTSSVDISGYFISDNPAIPLKYQLPNGVVIPANGYRIIWCSGRNQYTGGDVHTNFKITQTQASEDIVLSNTIGTLIDSHPIDIPNQKNHSTGRTIDGGTDWGVLLNPTPGGPNSNVSQTYAESPGFNQLAGFYTGSVTVNISVNDPGLTIYYTTSGVVPTNTSPVYSSQLTFTSTTVLRAVAYSSDPNVPPSFVNTKTFFVNETHTIPVISACGNDIPSLFGGNNGIEPDGHFELFDETGTRVSDASGTYDKHGNDSWAYDQRGVDFVTRDQYGYDYAVKHKIYDGKQRAKFQRVIIKAAANDNYSFEFGGAHIRDAYVHELSQRANMEMDERTYKPAVLYMNGQYWGLYEMREKVDDNDFTEYYYDQKKDDIQFIKTWGGTWARFGGQQALNDWNQLNNLIVNNNMAIPANYAMVEDSLNVLSLIDYIIMNTQVVCKDWLNYNTAWWRGKNPQGGAKKWRYTLWDMDATFGHYINYTGIPNDSPAADPCDNQSPSIDDPEGHTDMLTSLFDNPDFFALYINRYADLNNTYFTCDSMIGILDEMINIIDPEMQRQITRWGGSYTGWQNNVQDLRNFILTRCTVIDTGITDCYPVTGPYDLTVIVDPPGSGDVQVNTVIPTDYPFVSDYFDGIPLTLTAIPSGPNTFIDWTPNNATLTPNNTAIQVTFDLTQPDTIVAKFMVNSSCPPLNTTATSTDDICNVSNGTATASATGGTGPYNYQWDAQASNQTTATAINLAAGTYSLTVTDGASCPEVIMVTVQANAGTLSLTTNSTSASCSGNDGTASANPTGGTGPYNYQWDAIAANQTTATAINLVPGNYSVSVSDANGCQQVEMATVGSTSTFNLTSSSMDAVCSSANGSATATPVGGTGPFNYQWDLAANSQTTQTANNLATGTYTVSVTDVSNCIQIMSITVNSNSGTLSSTVSSTTANCGGANGTASVTPTGGNGPYTFQWDLAANSQTTQTAINLAGGSYTMSITDANGCTTVNSTIVGSSGNITATISEQEATCLVGNNGTATATANGGTGPYTYVWNTTPPQNNATAANLAPGIYTVSITDINGCTTTESTNVGIVGLLNLQANSTAVSCAGIDGTATINLTQGIAPYTFEWSTSPIQTTQTAVGLVQGAYTYTVTDGNGCFSLGNTSVPGPPAFSVGLSGTDLDCFGDNSGIASVSTPGTYTYQWSNNETTATINGLAAGTYTVSVTNGVCMDIQSITLTEPPMFSTNVITNDDQCSSNGASTTAIASGGNPPYQYEWDTGAMMPGIGGLSTGTYVVSITDANGCTQVETANVVSAANGPVLASMHTDISCPGDNDGTVEVTISNGTAPFSYNWGNGVNSPNLSGLPAGSYTVLVTDANGCLAVTTVVVNEPAPMTLVPFSTSSNGNDGTAAVNVNGGVPPYSYQWDNGQTTQVADGLAPGIYTVVVTDANGCITEGSVEVSIFSGIEDLEQLTKFEIFPNPSAGRFSVELGFSSPQEIELLVINTLGQQLENIKDSGLEISVPFDITEFSSGVYSIVLRTKDGRATRQVIKLD